MINEQKELEKLRILLKAMDSVVEEEDEPNFYGILKECAWDILHENPGSEYGDWQQALIEQYPTEVVDALGTNPMEVYASLADLWDSVDYEDEATGECHSFNDWAEYFATERSVELYDMFVEERREISRFERLISSRQ